MYILVSLTSCVYMCVYACLSEWGGGGSIPVMVCLWYAFCVSDWTLGAATYPSKKLAMTVRRYTKVLADGEG